MSGETFSIAVEASKGGRARAEGLSSERRSEIAKRAAVTRWHGSEAVVEPVARPVDDEIRQHHGVASAMGASNAAVRIWENEQTVTVRVWSGTSGVEEKLTPAAARYLADQLYGLAGRIDRRLGR